MTDTLSPPWLSVLIPAYNVAEYLDRCVRSVLDQSDDGVEIILCEDCSTDGTLGVARDLVSRHPERIRLLRHERNRGLSAARNTMIEDARGTYFWFVDSDDFLLPGAVAAVKRAIEVYSPDLVGGNYQKRKLPKLAFSGPSNRLVTDRDVFVSGICLSRKMYAWLKISHRSLWQSGLRFPEGRYFEDAAVTPFLALEASSFVHLRRRLLEYTIRPGSILSHITRTPDKFDVTKNLDLAHALDGVPAALDRQGVPMPKSRFAISHFIAMEFSKVVERIERAGPGGCGTDEVGALARRFHAIMNSSSPIPFDALIGEYRSRARFISLFKLRRALRFSQAG